MSNKYLETGRILNYHGLYGDMKIEHYCDNLDSFRSLPKVYIKKGDVYISHKIEKAVPLGSFTLLHLNGIEKIEDATKLKNTILYSAREDIKLQDGHIFVVDLIGLSVYNADNGYVYGKVKNFLDGKVSNIYEILTNDGEIVLLPAVDEFIVSADITKGIAIRPIPGFFNENEADKP